MELLILLPILIFSVILHEVSHGIIALQQGDDTAKVLGRITLNPMHHLDPLGSVIFPIICILTHLPIFGWAKPVPINPNRFFNYRSGVILVSLAGPLSNFVIAIVCTIFLYFSISQTLITGNFPFLPKILSQALLLNLVLAIFNLFPIPPLDGSKILSAILPQNLAELYDSIEPYGFFIMMGLIATGLLGKILYPMVVLVYHFLLSSFGIY